MKPDEIARDFIDTVQREFLEDPSKHEALVLALTSRFRTAMGHAADLERDRRGLLRLAAVATQLAEEIRQRQREGGAA